MAENWKQKVYADFSGGYNDISPGIDIQDNEMKLSENADYAAEVKALQTRKGCSKVNSRPYGANVADGYAWLVGSKYKKCIVIDGKLYDITSGSNSLDASLESGEDEGEQEETQGGSSISSTTYTLTKGSKRASFSELEQSDPKFLLPNVDVYNQIRINSDGEIEGVGSKYQTTDMITALNYGSKYFKLTQTYTTTYNQIFSPGWYSGGTFDILDGTDGFERWSITATFYGVKTVTMQNVVSTKASVYDHDEAKIYPKAYYTEVQIADGILEGKDEHETSLPLSDLAWGGYYFHITGYSNVSENKAFAEDGWYRITGYSTGADGKRTYEAYRLTIQTSTTPGNYSSSFKCFLSPGATHIYPYMVGNVLYFGDGQELWQWGATDFASESGLKSIGTSKIVKCNYINDLPTEDYKSTDRTQDIKVGTFVKNVITNKTYKSLKERNKVDLETDDYNSTTNWSEIKNGAYGEQGHFYISLSNLGAVNLKHENYKDTTKWQDVTDVKNFSSSVVRKLQPYDPSKAEEVLVTVTSGATAAGTVTVSLDNTTKTFTVTDGEVVSSIVEKLSKVGFDDWTAAITGNAVMFTAKEKGSKANGYVDPSTSGITFTYETKTEGKDNDCDLTAIKKCTIFCVHQGSQRVFAAGNPEDNGLYYSEIGYGNYFKSEINKVYPAINGYGAVTGMINLSNSLLVSYESGWCAWSGATVLSDATWRILNLPYGCASPRTLCLTPNSFTYLAKDGIYCVSAALLSDDYVLLESSQIIKKLSENVVENTIQEFKNKKLCEAVFYDNVYMLTYSTNGEYCDRVLKYEWDTSSFTLVTGWRVNRWLNDPESLYFASNNFILKAFERYTDVYTEDVMDEEGNLVHAAGDDKAIELHVKTKEFFFDSPITNKVVQMVGLIFQQHDNLHSSIEIIIHAGYKSYHLRPTDLAESLYYGREWGKIWGYREAIVKMIELVMVSNTFQIELKCSNIEDPITLIGIGFVYDTTDLVIPTILKDEELLR